MAILESAVEKLRNRSRPVKDWQRTLGMFAGDELMKRIDREARKVRESDRRAALDAMATPEQR